MFLTLKPLDLSGPKVRDSQKLQRNVIIQHGLYYLSRTLARLFASPKRAVKQQQQQEKISPYKWMRQEFESPEVEPAKRSLLYKLDEVARGVY